MAHANNNQKIKSPEWIRQHGNHLKDQPSLYLQQHAHNPVNWYPWTEEALSRARSEDKPIFLSIGYASCHWCHVMEHEVFENLEVAAALNKGFIAIKVDREERPDIDAVYMQAVQALTGGGGWPMSVFLTPEREPFFGGTYIPRENFLALLARITSLYASDRQRVHQQASLLAQHLAQEITSTEGKLPGLADFQQTADTAQQEFDSTWGGSKGHMKFPTPLRWTFLLHLYRKTGDEKLAGMVRKTLSQMSSGGIYDHVDGGFHRYTVEPTWLIPHFEKMLYDNALLANLYIEASVVLAEPRFSQVAIDTLDFLLDHMQSDDGGFYASFDADSGGREGDFYVWRADEIESVAGPLDGPPLAMLLGVSPAGNFEGSNVLTRRVAPSEVAKRFDLAPGDVDSLFQKVRPDLQSYRAKRSPPSLDHKIITAWNGLAISAFARGFGLFGDPRYRDAAEKAAAFLWAHHRQQDGSLLRASNGGLAENEAVLDDYAFLSNGLLDLSTATGDSKWIEKSQSLVDYVRRHFKHPQAAFYFTPKHLETPLGRQVELADHVRPSGNAAMLQCLLRLAALTGKQVYRQEAIDALEAHAGTLKRFGLGMAWWYDAALRLGGPYYEVVISGSAEAADTKTLRQAVVNLVPPHADLLIVPAAGPGSQLKTLLPPTAGKKALGKEATAYLCQQGSCQAPTHDADKLRAGLLRGWSH